jgi:hypothetical protein
MTLSKPQAIWREQCEAAHGIKERYGLNAALDYLLAEKLLNHAAAAAQNADFARELPSFVAEVRRMFELDDIANYLAQMERRDREQELADLADDEEDAFAETASQLAARKQRFALIKELLTRPQLGTA